MKANSGFIDRIEAGKAIIIMGEEEKETIYTVDHLYEDAKEGDYVQMEGETLLFDQEETKKRKDTISAKMKKLNMKKR